MKVSAKLALVWVALTSCACLVVGLLAHLGARWYVTGIAFVTAIGALSVGMAWAVRLLVTDPLHRAMLVLDRVAGGDVAVDLPPEGPGEFTDLAASVGRVAASIKAAREREEHFKSEDAERQRRSIVALEDLEHAESSIAAGDAAKALDHLAAIPDNLGMISRKSRLLRIDLALKQQDEQALEQDLMRGNLASFPPKVLRTLASQMETIMRFDLALECLRTIESQKPGQPAILSRISRLQHIVVESGDATLMMQAARKALGRQFYEIRYLQSGGMGLVVKARQRTDARPVAIKVLPPAYAADVELSRRFKREVRSLMMIDHPNVVKILGEVDGEMTGYFMELLEGLDVEKFLRNRLPLPVPEAAALAIKMLAGLHHAHERGIIHRDVKPANFLRLPDGHIKLVDFGLAKVEDNTTMTAIGSRMGTPAYMAPEQMKGLAEVGEAADVYSMGVILFEMLAGRRPFPDTPDLVEKVFESAPPLRSFAPKVPKDVADMVDLCLLRDPPRRLVCCPDVVAVLSPYAQKEPAP